jgi:hypothetical protein
MPMRAVGSLSTRKADSVSGGRASDPQVAGRVRQPTNLVRPIPWAFSELSNQCSPISPLLL